MKPRLMIAAAVAATLGAAAHAAPADSYRARTTADLVAVCSTTSGEKDYASAIAFCHGVLAGAYNYYDLTTLGSKRFVCPPDPAPKRAQVASDFVAWAKARPQYMDAHGIDTLFRFAAEKYPCR
jgi:hypothetical protein